MSFSFCTSLIHSLLWGTLKKCCSFVQKSVSSYCRVPETLQRVEILLSKDAENAV